MARRPDRLPGRRLGLLKRARGGASARVRWNGRGSGGGLAPPGWATLNGVVRPSQARDSNHLLLRNGDGGVLDCWFGRYGDRILVGDRNADGVWAPAAVRSGTWTLRETHAPDSPVATLSFGRSGDRYLVGRLDNRPQAVMATAKLGRRTASTLRDVVHEMRHAVPCDDLSGVFEQYRVGQGTGREERPA